MLLLKETKNGLCSLAFSPDGQMLAASGYHGTVLLWDLAAGTFLNKRRGCDRKVETVFFAGKELYGHEFPSLWVWDLTSDSPPQRRPKTYELPYFAAIGSVAGDYVCLGLHPGLHCYSLPKFELAWSTDSWASVLSF